MAKRVTLNGLVVLAALAAVLCAASGAAVAASAIDRSGWTATSITGPAPQLILQRDFQRAVPELSRPEKTRKAVAA